MRQRIIDSVPASVMRKASIVIRGSTGRDLGPLTQTGESDETSILAAAVVGHSIGVNRSNWLSSSASSAASECARLPYVSDG
jgi:hypothetical protein